MELFYAVMWLVVWVLVLSGNLLGASNQGRIAIEALNRMHKLDGDNHKYHPNQITYTRCRRMQILHVLLALYIAYPLSKELQHVLHLISA